MKLKRTAKIGLAIFGVGVLILVAVAVWMRSVRSTSAIGHNLDDTIFAGAALDELGIMLCIVGGAMFLISVLMGKIVSSRPKTEQELDTNKTTGNRL